MTNHLLGNSIQHREDPKFPLTGEALRVQDLAMLKETIWAPQEKIQERADAFGKIWHDRWGSRNEATPDFKYFQTLPDDGSPFADFSSKGWKLHIAFEKGKEEAVSKFLFSRGLYFKTEAGMGTAFNGKNILLGSGSDIEVAPRVMARFDVQKSAWGLKGNGSGKYAEDGLPSWTNAFGVPSGLPVLYEDAKTVGELNDQMKSGQKPLSEVLAVFRDLQKKAEHELVGDFGHDFVVGDYAEPVGAVAVRAS